MNRSTLNRIKAVSVPLLVVRFNLPVRTATSVAAPPPEFPPKVREEIRQLGLESRSFPVLGTGVLR